MNQLQITVSVGVKGRNNRNDVKAIQSALNQLIHLISPAKKLAVD